MKKKILVVFLATTLIAGLTACGEKDGSSATNSGSAVDQESTDSNEKGADEESAKTSSSEEPVTFQFVQAQPEYQTAAQKLIQTYMEEHPNVTIELITNNDNLKTDLQVGNIPEIFYTEGYGNLKEYTDYITDLSDQDWVENILDNSLDAVTMDGKVYGFPTTLAGEGIVYNKKLFKEKGWEVPVTFSELKALCDEMVAAGITPFVNEFGDDWLLGQLLSGGGYTYIPDTQEFTDKLYAGEVTFADNEQMKGLFNVIDLMLSYGLPDSLSYSWNETCSAFATGQAAMTFEGDWIWSTVEPIDPEIECGMFPVPVSDNPDEAKLLVDTNMVLHIGKGSKEPEAAKEFLNWMATSDTAREVLLQDYQFVPCFEGWEYEGTNQLAASTKEYMSSGKAGLWWWQKWPDGFRANAGQELQKYISGDATADETLKAIDVLWGNMAN